MYRLVDEDRSNSVTRHEMLCALYPDKYTPKDVPDPSKQSSGSALEQKLAQRRKEAMAAQWDDLNEFRTMSTPEEQLQWLRDVLARKRVGEATLMVSCAAMSTAALDLPRALTLVLCDWSANPPADSG